MEKSILGKPLSQWQREYPIMVRIAAMQETAWLNPGKLPFIQAAAACPLTMAEVEDTSARLDRFADYLMTAFPETVVSGGILESPLRVIPAMQQCLAKTYHADLPGKMWIKLDSQLPISGSIKARGGIYEILKFAEDIALERGLLHKGDPYRVFASESFRKVFSQYSVAVGSTGNLGLSIGIISAKLGFRVTIHMSADARQWKKDLLRSKGVTVIEYPSDYSVAVAKGRADAKKDSYCHFVDDENSKTLFLGYSVAALRLQKQFLQENLTVDTEHPLFVYLPCGVGGGPGGVAFGLKMVFGDAVHCFFAEPTHSCSMMLGMATGLNSDISVQDLGIDNRTIADGLAVGRPSSFVGKVMAPFVSGCYSLDDGRMYRLLAQFSDAEHIELEPSALAGMYGPVLLATDPVLSQYPAAAHLNKAEMAHSTQLVWATGGGMVPRKEMAHYYAAGKALL
ncbi:D-serine ammonia-lyase [Caproiciproducens sp.]|uniref:D-serine ammonia-lyase n=1 Tax=Caproiciproducens sp. TaxID=1954376 RepID=UPI0028976E0D|nr:D-serine ammonia-lyase [Caproiciproducens sp.]